MALGFSRFSLWLPGSKIEIQDQTILQRKTAYLVVTRKEKARAVDVYMSFQVRPPLAHPKQAASGAMRLLVKMWHLNHSISPLARKRFTSMSI